MNEVQSNIRLLGPMVEQGVHCKTSNLSGISADHASEDYQRVKEATDRAALLSQKIIDARTALILLRQTHPKPRLTIPLAEQKLQDQVEEMQMLNDQVQDIKQKAKTEKGRVKTGTVDVENLRLQAAEAEKAVKSAQLDEDDSRLVPLYDWWVHSFIPVAFLLITLYRYTASLALHRSITNLENSHSVSENELQLTYKIDMPSPSPPHHIVIALIFAPDTRKLAAAQVSGLDELGVEAGDVIDAHVQVDDPHGLIAALLARARAAALA